MIFLLNLIGFIIEMIVCPILMIPFLMWRLLVILLSYRPEMPSETETQDSTREMTFIGKFEIAA